MTGAKLIAALKKKFRVKTDAALVNHLGISIPSIQQWKNRSSITYLQIASLVHKASFQSNVVQPVVEFFPIHKCYTKQKAAYEVFSVSDGANGQHPYRSGLKDELNKHHGVYVFFDSRGQAIYAGKARKQKLWKELNLAFNRDRKDVQMIRRVSHPDRRQAYQTPAAHPRQITAKPVALHELAAYFSAYQVPDTMINAVEAMLVRSFANDLLNIKMEKFSK
jgi:hypothetical protein